MELDINIDTNRNHDINTSESTQHKRTMPILTWMKESLIPLSYTNQYWYQVPPGTPVLLLLLLFDESLRTSTLYYLSTCLPAAASWLNEWTINDEKMNRFYFLSIDLLCEKVLIITNQKSFAVSDIT